MKVEEIEKNKKVGRAMIGNFFIFIDFIIIISNFIKIVEIAYFFKCNLSLLLSLK